MKNKTCGECRYYFEQADFCRLNAWECIEEDEKCCEDFEPPTNGDRIRQMSDEKLAEKFLYHVFLTDCLQRKRSYWRSTFFPCNNFSTKEKAIAATVEELKKEYKE